MPWAIAGLTVYLAKYRRTRKLSVVMPSGVQAAAEQAGSHRQCAEEVRQARQNQGHTFFTLRAAFLLPGPSRAFRTDLLQWLKPPLSCESDQHVTSVYTPPEANGISSRPCVPRAIGAALTTKPFFLPFLRGKGGKSMKLTPPHPPTKNRRLQILLFST